MILKSIFEQIGFVSRYRTLCENYKDFENRLKGNNKKKYHEIIKRFDQGVLYVAKDKMFKVSNSLKDLTIDLGVSIQDGLVEARFFYIENGKWLLFDRFDFIAEKLSVDYDRGIHNLPKFSSEDDLHKILEDIFSIYKDLVRCIKEN